MDQDGQNTQNPNQQTADTQNPPPTTDNLQATSTPPPTIPPSEFGKKSVTGKFVATILGVLFLIGGVTAGVLLVSQQQEIRERAAVSEECVHSGLCTLLDEPDNTQTYEATSEISHLIVTSGNTYRFEPGVSNNGCLRVTISKNIVMWSKYSTQDGCENVTDVQVWLK